MARKLGDSPPTKESPGPELAQLIRIADAVEDIRDLMITSASSLEEYLGGQSFPICVNA